MLWPKATTKSLVINIFWIIWLLNSQVNGLSRAPQQDMKGRIVGGSLAATNSAPYIVSLQQNSVHYCGGSILNANWVLTAAHCLASKTTVLSSVIVAGTNDIANKASTAQVRPISSYVVHDLYVGGIAPYDVGMVYTKTAFQWTVAVKPISLPKLNVIPTGVADLYGWGSTSTTSVPQYPNQLNVAKSIPIIDLSSCESALGAKGVDVHQTNLCTGPLTGGVGICSSDSGGPLVQSDMVIGIVSWGKVPCGQKNSPSVYVRVSAFVNWIEQNQIVKSV